MASVCVGTHSCATQLSHEKFINEDSMHCKIPCVSRLYYDRHHMSTTKWLDKKPDQLPCQRESATKASNMQKSEELEKLSSEHFERGNLQL